MDIQSVAPFVPIIVEATKFMFNQAGQWLTDAQKRAKPEDQKPASVGELATSPINAEGSPVPQIPSLDKEQFGRLESDYQSLVGILNKAALETHAYTIKGLVAQLQVHRKNLTDLESVEAEYGVLTPQHIKRSIERESSAIITKTQQLQAYLTSVYERKLKIE